MVVDYCNLNNITKPINFLISNFDDMLEKLNRAKFFIIFYLALGYLQVPLAEVGKEKQPLSQELTRGNSNIACLD